MLKLEFTSKLGGRPQTLVRPQLNPLQRNCSMATEAGQSRDHDVATNVSELSGHGSVVSSPRQGNVSCQD